jgi:hypothetical protein
LQEGLKNRLVDIKIRNKETGRIPRIRNDPGERYSCGKRADIGNNVSAGNEIQAALKLPMP